jgi:hypothetical protein
MGLFDTILLDPPLACSRCGAPLELQTKQFDSMMLTYRIGAIVRGSPVVSGILEDLGFCHECRRENREATDPVYLVVWHHILAGVERTESDAEARLVAVDRLDLIEWLDEAQRAAGEWRQRFRRLYADVRMWHEHLQRDDSEDHDRSRAAARALASFHRPPDEILNADDPLAELLTKHENNSPEEDAFF